MRRLTYGGLIIFLISLALRIDVFPSWFLWILLLTMGTRLVTFLFVLRRKVGLELAASLTDLTNAAFFIALAAGSPVSLASAGSILVVCGILSNEIACRANGMKMPVRSTDPELETSEKHTRMDGNTKLSWLGDCIPILGVLASIGDIFFVSGLYIAAVGLI